MSTMIPPLSQSRQKLLACPELYVHTVIRGKKEPPNEASTRGTAVHHFMSEYVRHLVQAKKRQDPELFDLLLKGVAPDAREILEEMRDFAVDPEYVFATEYKIMLEEDFTPFTIDGADPIPSYEMTLDLIEITGEATAEIRDYKSQYQTIDPDTFQARLYSMGLMMANPFIHEVRFTLHFVRWGTAKTAVYTREDVPRIQEEARKYRERQIKLHDGQDGAILGRKYEQAIPGNHCVYCPLLGDGCPIEDNPYSDPEGHLKNVLYYKAALRKSEMIVKAHADKEPLTTTDANGVEYRAEWQTSVRKKFGLDALPTLLDWQKRQEPGLLTKLSISGLSNLLKAKKRADLAEACSTYCDNETVAKFHIGRAGEEAEEE